MHDGVPVLHESAEALQERVEELERKNRELAAQIAREAAARREVEAALSERQRQLSEAQRLAQLGSWSWAVGSDRVSWSEELFRIYGHAPHNNGVDFGEYVNLIHPEDRTGVLQIVERVLATGGQFEFHHRITRPDGQVRMIQGRGEVAFGPDGKPIRMFGTAQDITERKEADEQLRASEESYRTIFELSSDAVFVQDIETGAVLDANQKACEIQGRTLEEFKGQRLTGIGEGCDAGCRDVTQACMRRAAQGEPQLFESRLLRKTGELVWVEVSVRRVNLRGRDLLLISVRGIEERKQAEAALQRARAELEQRVEARTAELAQRTDELAQAEQRFRAIVEASPTPLLFSRLTDGVILYANDRLEALVGVPPGSLEGKVTADFYTDPSVRPQVLEAIRQHGQVRDMELQITRADGTTRWTSINAQRLMFNGQPTLAASLLDITRRKRAEEALRASEESYRGLFDNLTDLVYVQDLEGRFVNVNEAVVRAYGYSREELIGRTPDILGDPGRVDVEAVKQAFGRAIGGSEERFEWWARRKDGSTFPKEVVLKRATYFGQDVVIAVARDISDRKEADAALRRSERYFRRLIENASDLITVLSPEGTVRYESPGITAMLGYEPEELVGRQVFELIAPEDAGHTMVQFRKILEHPGEPFSADLRFLHKDGTWRMLEAVGSTLSPESAAEGVVVNSRDVTERRRAEAALHESERRYAESLERELELGRQIQRGFLPSTLPQLPGWEIDARFHPAQQVAGDFYDAFELSPGRIGLVIADVCGKGVGAALFMAIFRTLIRTYAERASVPSAGALPSETTILHEAMTATNEYVARLHKRAHMFASAFFGLLDPGTGTLHYVNAGHEPPLVIGPKGPHTRLIPSGPALGLMAGATFSVEQVVLEPGEVFLAYTDGITEARSAERDFFSEERLLDLLNRPPLAAARTLDDIEQALRGFAGEAEPSDDRTLLALRRSTS